MKKLFAALGVCVFSFASLFAQEDLAKDEKKNQKQKSEAMKYKLKTDKVEEKVVNAYKSIENGVVGAYKAVENGVVGTYKKVEDKFVETFLEEVEPKQEENVVKAEEKSNENR